MSNVATLMNAGLIAANTVLTQADQNTIESLSSAEVNALISINQKVTTDFLSRNCGSSSPAASPTTHPIGIVF
ncbi:MAG: hypothetical protein WCC87_10785 [Candidatus Korobacteraceae bacterium]